MLVAVVSDSHNNSEAVDLAKKAISKCREFNRRI